MIEQIFGGLTVVCICSFVHPGRVSLDVNLMQSLDRSIFLSFSKKNE